MYKNNQLELLINAYRDSIPKEIELIISDIQNIYKAYNKNYKRYTNNYIALMENTFDNLQILQLIPESQGGRLRKSQPIDNDEIKSVLTEYYKKLFELRNLKFLSEEKKTIVFVGPNGCGKTTLLRNLIHATGEDKVGYYPADRLLVIDDSYNPERDFGAFSKRYIQTDRYASDINNQTQSHYITQQMTQAIALFEKRRATEMDLCAKGTLQLKDSITEKILKIWNELVKDRILFSEGALKVKTLDEKEYSIKYLSSGEKSIFYFLSCIFLKKQKTYYFIDEPENNLNPSIVSKLWDIIEEYCEGSIFVYLTHDSNFVSSRINSKLFWIKKYDGVDWIYEQLPENDNLPQDLVVTLVGNREPVLFCESQDEYKYDDIIFKMMFPDFKVVPAGGCAAVIAKVKAYSLVGLPQKAFGIIDCDYKEQRELDNLKSKGIYHMPFFEIENFLFSKEIITGVIKQYSLDKENAFEKIRQKLREDFISQKENWIIKKIAFYLRETYFDKEINRLSNFSDLREKYIEFRDGIDLNVLYTKYEEEIQKVIDKDDYNTLLKYYDNKGIFNKFLPQLKLKGEMQYREAVFSYLMNNKNVLSELRKRYLPDILA